MVDIQFDLSQRIASLEKELQAALNEKERRYQYQWDHGKIRFERRYSPSTAS